MHILTNSLGAKSVATSKQGKQTAKKGTVRCQKPELEDSRQILGNKAFRRGAKLLWRRRNFRTKCSNNFHYAFMATSPGRGLIEII